MINRRNLINSAASILGSLPSARLALATNAPGSFELIAEPKDKPLFDPEMLGLLARPDEAKPARAVWFAQ